VHLSPAISDVLLAVVEMNQTDLREIGYKNNSWLQSYITVIKMSELIWQGV